ncbi:hypothetical protein NW767_014875 [Fusarium falciforme]|nr:hypothetical protein NW767_014875 [Fusarium falciforme]
MSFPISPRRFALLVGIDLYLAGSRQCGNGKLLSLGELRGCVNDVQAVAEFLRNEFQMDDPRILCSSRNRSGFAYSTEPKEPPDRWPTFDNIKREFDTVAEHASAGDLFFFQFSGHGARLQPTSKSPPGRSTDPSLITMDFCCGKPAVRGWQLNQWLKRLNEKKIRTIVILDSCHSGGAFRTGGSFRTPEGWTNIPALPVDEEAVAETAVESGNRDAELEMSWSINPDGFTLMAACESQERAAETTIDGISHGAFTHALLDCLKQNRPNQAVVTYRNLRDQIAKQVHGQTPRVYGRDRLVFFGDKEPFSATPLVVRLEGRKLFLPIGKVHGVREGSEFTLYPPTTHARFSVDQVDDFECSAPDLSDDEIEALQRHNYQIVPCRWSLGDGLLQVLVQPNLGSEFRAALYAALQDRVVGDIEITESNDSHELGSAVFSVSKRDDGGIDLTGPVSLTGCDGPVRGLDITDANIVQLAAKSAAVLAHLTRFEQIRNLSGKASQQLTPFELALKPTRKAGSCSRGQGIDFVFRNTSKSQLHLTVLVLSSAFHVKQLYPSEDFPVPVDPGCKDRFTFHITVPDPLNSHGEQQDTIRSIVTRGRQLSWKSLELPDIWNADQLDYKRSSPGRDAELLHDFTWWIRDNVVLTTKQSEGDKIYWVSDLVG